MRLHEILSEAVYGDGAMGTPGEVDPAFDAVNTGMNAFKQLRNTDSYMQYRMGIALAAASSDQPFDQESAYAENFLVGTYTPEELEIMNKAAKLMGVTPTKLTSQRSQEPPNTNKASVVAKPKRNRYGV